MLYSKSTKITCLSLILLALLCSKNPLWAMDSDPEINQSEEEISQGDNTPMDSEPQKIPNTSSNCDWSQFCFEEDSDCMDSEQSHDSVNISWDNDDCSQDDSILKQEAISSNSPHDTRGFHVGSHIPTGSSISTSIASLEAQPYETITHILCNTIESLVTNPEHINDLDILREFIKFFEQKIYSDTFKNLFLTEGTFNQLKESLTAVGKGNVSSYVILCKKILETKNISRSTKNRLEDHLTKLHETLKDVLEKYVNSGEQLHIYNKKCFIVISFLRKIESIITLEPHLKVSNDNKLKAFIALDHINLPEFAYRHEKLKGGHIHQKDGYYELWNSQDEEKPRIAGFCCATTNIQGNKLGYWICCKPSIVSSAMEEDNEQQETIDLSNSNDEISGFKFTRDSTSSTTAVSTTYNHKHSYAPLFKVSTLFADGEFDLLWNKIKDLTLTSEAKDNIIDSFSEKNVSMDTDNSSCAYTMKVADCSSYYNMPIRENTDSSVNIPTLFPLFVINVKYFTLRYNPGTKTLSLVRFSNNATVFECSPHGNAIESSTDLNNLFASIEPGLTEVVSLEDNTQNHKIQPKITKEEFSTTHMCHILRNLLKGYYFIVQNLDENKTECDYCLVEVAKYVYVKVFIQ